MNKAPKDEKWFTCTPVRFVGDHTFFARDSGLLCKGFQKIGIECKAIMPGPPMDVDQVEDLIRTDYQNLENPEWWRSHGASGVVLYAWGSGKYTKIACAIKQAGLTLVTHMDTAGMLGIFNGFGKFTHSLLAICKGESCNHLVAYSKFVLRLAYTASLGILKNDLRRAQHLKQADIIGAITPIAMQRIQKVCRVYGGEALAKKVRLIPPPSSPYMRYDPSIPKESLVIAVGRWDDAKIKGTELLQATVMTLLVKSSSAKVEIYGPIPAAMEHWQENLSDKIRDRVKLMGKVSNDVLAMALQRASISLCTSLREGYHTVSAEALCCGCSIVGPNVEEIPSMKYFTADGSGRMAPRQSEALATAVLEELAIWHAGKRDPEAISERWTARLHAPNVARSILKVCEPYNE